MNGAFESASGGRGGLGAEVSMSGRYRGERSDANQRRRFPWLAGLVLLGLAATTGCNGNASALRATLAAREASWHQQLGALRAQHAALHARLDGLARGAAAARTARATVAGIGQSLVDVEAQSRQASARIDQSIDRGGEAGEKALEEEGGLIDGYLQSLASGVASASADLDRLTASEAQATAETE